LNPWATGCERWHIIRHVLLPEALPSIVAGFTITVVSMIGASAMAGAVGASGELQQVPYKIVWSEFPNAAPLLEALRADAIDDSIVRLQQNTIDLYVEAKLIPRRLDAKDLLDTRFKP